MNLNLSLLYTQIELHKITLRADITHYTREGLIKFIYYCSTNKRKKNRKRDETDNRILLETLSLSQLPFLP